MIVNDYVSFPIWVEIVGIFVMLSGQSIPGDHLSEAGQDEPRDIFWRRLFLAVGLCGVTTYFLVVERSGVEHIRAAVEMLRPA